MYPCELIELTTMIAHTYLHNQPHVGRSSRAHYNYQLWDREQAGSVQVPSRHEYSSVNLRRFGWLRVHPIDPEIVHRPYDSSFNEDSMASEFGCGNISDGVPVRLC